METNKDKLINILKTCPQTKKDMEELKLGCVIEYAHNGEEYKSGIILKKEYGTNFISYKLLDGFIQSENCISKIIGTLQERHLRMYCESKGIHLIIDEKGNVKISGELGIYNFIAKLDNTKDFDQQLEEVYEAIYKFLSELDSK